ncbi:MAG: hypothetical protein AABZ45_06445 [Pseudomonadota bacterium]
MNIRALLAMIAMIWFALSAAPAMAMAGIADCCADDCAIGMVLHDQHEHSHHGSGCQDMAGANVCSVCVAIGAENAVLVLDWGTSLPTASQAVAALGLTATPEPPPPRRVR